MITAEVLIADSITKILGVAGVESIAMKNAITSVWIKDAEKLADEVVTTCINFSSGEVRPEYASAVLNNYRLKLGSDFIEEVLPHIYEYVGRAWDKGREHSLSSMFSKDVGESVISDLVSITGSTKENVQRTVQRWFKETQGRYFERFIVPETARLLSYAAENEEKIDTLRSIGQRYKEFVKADAYWSAVSEFNAETSKVFAQVQTLHEIGVHTYTIEAIIDEKTCEVCLFLNGSTWTIEEAVTRMYDLLIAEEDNAASVNPFPPRSTPSDFESPSDSPYLLPPYHPRCRCNVVAEHSVTALPQEILARPFSPKKPPSDNLLDKVYANYVKTPTKADVEAMIRSGELPDYVRSLTNAEKKVARSAWQSIPYELRKWASRNKSNYELIVAEGEKVVSRVEGNRIILNSKFFNTRRYGPEVIQHELRHALINREIISVRGGGDLLWDEIQSGNFRGLVHVNRIYQVNGARGTRAATAAADEFIAVIGDYYKKGMSLDDLVKAVRDVDTGIDVATKAGQIKVVKDGVRWTAAEAKRAVQYWWQVADIDDLTLLSKKEMLAKITYKPASKEIRAVAISNELRLRDILRSAGIKEVHQLGDNEPFDVWIGADPTKWYLKPTKKGAPKHVIEIKTIVRGKNNKITMHGDSLAKKLAERDRFGKGVKVHTVVFDERAGKIYYKNDLGSFRLSAMQEVTEADLQKLVGGKPAVGERQAEKLTYTEITSKADFKKFRANMEMVKEEHKKFLDWYTWEEYQEKGIRVYMEKNGFTGYGIDPDGTIVTLWSRADAPAGIGRKSIASAIKNGADRLECFDGKLPTIYREFGFKEVARYPWNDDFAPPGWNYEKFGRPDYLNMRLSTATVETSPQLERIASTSNVRLVDSDDLKTSSRIDKGNVNTVEIVTIGGGRKKYIYKPVEGESYFSKGMIDDILDAVNYQFSDARVLELSDLKPEHWQFLDEVGMELPLLRQTVRNTEVPLAHREAFALDVAHRLGLNNEYGVVPKFMLAEDSDGNLAGILTEFISNAVEEVDYKYVGRNMLDEEVLQMGAFDYLIGNTDRHAANWLRKTKATKKVREGTPVYIDHGYCMPGQYQDLGGISEWRFQAAMYARGEMEYDIDPDFVVGLADRIQKFVDEDASRLARSYGFSEEEIDAMLRRGDSLAERLRGGSFGWLLQKHEDNGLYGLTDSYIG